MSTIRNTLQLLGYSESRIEATAKLLLITNKSGVNAFENFVNLITQNDVAQGKMAWLNLASEIRISEKDIPSNWLINTVNIWQDEELTRSVLDHEFNCTNHQLLKFLVSLTQLQFILGSRFEIFSGITNIYELDNSQTVSFAIRRLVKDLEFSNERKYLEEDGEIKSIFLHAATEKALATRISIIKEIVMKQEEPLIVYYTTNPRGLSKAEASTPEILASWFTSDYPLRLNIANTIKDIFSRKDINFDWFNGLDKLRRIILESVNTNFGLQLLEFPSAPSNEIYPPIYDETAILDGNRDPLNNKWPHVGHLINYLSHKAGLSSEKIHVKVIPVAGMVVDGRYKPAQTKELIEAFFTQREREFSETNMIYAVSDNSVSYSAIRQDTMLKLLAKNFKNESATIITYYDSICSDQIDFERITKEVAAQFYTHYELNSDIESVLTNDSKYQKKLFQA